MTISDKRLQGLIELFYEKFSRGNFSHDVRDTIAALRELQYSRARPSAPEGWLEAFRGAFITCRSDGPYRLYEVVAKFKTLHEAQNAHGAIVDALDARPLPPAPTAEEV